MIRFHEGVKVGIWNEYVHKIIEQASMWSALTEIDVDVNSINDKTHGANSLHYYDLAIDLDTEGDREDDIRNLWAYLSRYLPGEFDVVLERDHVHVEFDLKRHAPAIPPLRGDRA